MTASWLPDLTQILLGMQFLLVGKLIGETVGIWVKSEFQEKEVKHNNPELALDKFQNLIGQNLDIL